MKRRQLVLIISKEEVKQYLVDVKKAVNLGRYKISPREKNELLYDEYIFSEARCKDIILGLKVEDFSKADYNDHSDHPEEILYVFGKEVQLLPKYGGDEETVALYIKFNKLTNMYVIVVSFHKQEYPLKYQFK